ncbi:MAG: tetratricopeptide repeat protein [Treponema sp.]|nr:tetratricopeptide repeat protein [Treponema sp.]
MEFLRRKLLTGFFFLVLFCIPGFSQEKKAPYLVQGLEAYRNGDWASSALFLRKAAAGNDSFGAENYYILILSDMYGENYPSCINDCDYFLKHYPDSSLRTYIEYQKGRALHYMGQNDSAAILLSDFCHQNPDDDLFPSALYWLAECFYDDYNFDTAAPLYERIVAEFPDCSKAEDAKFKLELISQREREQKLLYLLRMTGEEYLSSRETYEKQLREYQTEDLVSLRNQLNAANRRIAELEKNAATAASAAAASHSATNEDVKALKTRALQIQKLLDEKTSASTGKEK